MYELYTFSLLDGSESRYYETLQEVTDVLTREHYSFKWDYRTGREVLRENDRGGVAQVFHDGQDITGRVFPSWRDLPVF